MIDLHSHVLPGLDDGARTLDDAVAVARQAAADGVTVLAATPHVRPDWPTTPEQMEHGVAELRAALTDAGVALELVEGAELALDSLGSLSEDDLRRFSYGQKGAYVLLECPYSGSPLELLPAIRVLGERGLTAIVGHPERNPDVADRPTRVEALVKLGALIQLTALSVEGALGRRPRETASKLLELGLAHVLASDAHGPHIREGGLPAAVAAIGDESLARYLTEEAPAAILAGEPVPAAPRRQRRRRFFPF